MSQQSISPYKHSHVWHWYDLNKHTGQKETSHPFGFDSHSPSLSVHEHDVAELLVVAGQAPVALRTALVLFGSGNGAVALGLLAAHDAVVAGAVPAGLSGWG